MATEFTSAETLQLVRQKAIDSKIDSFRVKIMKRKPGAAFLDTIAMLDGTRAEHLVFPEAWLSSIAGGGDFQLAAFHSGEPTMQIGGHVQVVVGGESVRVDPLGLRKTLSNDNWQGPQGPVVFPVSSATDRGTVATSFTAQPPNAEQRQQEPARVDAPPPRTDPIYLQSLEALQKQQRELDDYRRRLELEQSKREADARVKAVEDRAEQSMARMREDQRALTAKLDQLLAGGGPNAAPKESVATMITAVAAVVMPVVKEIIDSNRESARAQREAMIEQGRKTDALLEKISSKPPIDPFIEKLLEKKDDGGMKAVQQMAEATAGVMSTMMNAVAMITESGLVGGQPESTIAQIAQAASAFFAGMQEQKPVRMVRPPRPQLPQAPQLPPPQAQPQAQPQFAGDQPKRKRPAAKPAPAVAVEGAPKQGQAAPVAEAPVPAPVRVPVDHVGQLETLIKAHSDPSIVAEKLFSFFDDDNSNLHAAMEAAGGTIQGLFVHRLGEWVNSNPVEHAPYIQKLLEIVIAEGERLGFIAQDDEDQGDDEGGEEGDEDAEDHEQGATMPPAQA